MADATDRLYELPLEEFTAARNELAKTTGDASVKQLKKPTVPAWAVNQLSRRREVDLRRLLRAGEKLEEAQKEAVRGGSQSAFERARSDERDAVRRLRTAAAEVLREGGHPASDQSLERIAQTLHAGAATEEGRATLRAGRLTDDIEPQGFDAFAALAGQIAPPTARAKKPERGRSAAEQRRAEQAREAAATARREADEAKARLDEAERQLAKLRREAERASERAERAEAKARELAD
jgi:chromosome segregation ATPase